MAKITRAELRELLQREKIDPSRVFSKEQLLNDEKLMKAIDDEIELKQYRADNRALNEEMQREVEKDKLKGSDEDEFIPGGPPIPLTEEEKKKQKKDNELIPGVDDDLDKDENSLIPD